MNRRDLDDLAKFLAERRAYLSSHGGLVKRAPDQPVITKTVEDVKLWPTITRTILAPTQYLTITTTNLVTSTVTPPPVTVLNGRTTAAQVVTTLPTSTRTVKQYTISWDIQTKKITQT
jgi:hypothetical protein